MPVKTRLRQAIHVFFWWIGEPAADNRYNRYRRPTERPPVVQRFPSIRRHVPLLTLALALAGCGSRGIHVSGFLTPTYRLPSGYSETYRSHLYAHDVTPVQKELLDPALLELPPPAPYSAPPGPTPQPRPSAGGMPSKDRLPFPPAPTPDAGSSSGLKKP